MNEIKITKLNEVFLHFECSDMGIEQELIEFFSYYVPNYQFMPKFKARLWDGKIKLAHPVRKTLYVGLLQYLIEFAKNSKYIIKYINEMEEQKVDLLTDLNNYAQNLIICARNRRISLHDYQLDAINHALMSKRCILQSPTASGKSAIIYVISRYLMEHDLKCLVIVPNTSLVEQFYSDFEDYSSANGWSTQENCQKIYSGFPKEIKSNLVFSTWQSIYKLPAAWFRQFNCIIGDEAHQFTGQSLTSIMEKLTGIEYRIGTTGSLSDSKVHTLVLEGLFGPVNKVVTTSELQESGKLSKLEISSIVLQYTDEERKLMKGKDYAEEINFIIGHTKRNKFITNLACKSTGTTLVLFQMVKKHGKILYDLISSRANGRSVYFIYGSTPTEERERIRQAVEKEENAIIVASYGCYSTGINIPSIENIIFASPFLSKIRNLQSIGRGLRLSNGKTHCKLYDITDDLRWKTHKNHTLKHGAERYKLYIEEKFPVKIIEVKI